MTEEKSKTSFADQLKIKDTAGCLEAMKNGWIAGTVSIGLTILVVLIGIFSGSDNDLLAYYADPLMFIDIVFMGILVFFMYKRSRVAATLMFVYFVGSKLVQWTDLGGVQGLPMALIFMFFYGNAMRATFLWHSKYKQIYAADEI